MLFNFFKISIRRFWKEKKLNLLLILCFSIGLICFGMTNYYLEFIRGQYLYYPNSSKIANIYSVDQTTKRYGSSYQGRCINNIFLYNPLKCEKIAYSGMRQKDDVTFFYEGKEVSYILNSLCVTKDFPQVYSLEFIDGDLRVGSIVLSESYARKVYGKSNPVGNSLFVLSNENGKLLKKDYVITGVVKDLPKGLDEWADMYVVIDDKFTDDKLYSGKIALLFDERLDETSIETYLPGEKYEWEDYRLKAESLHQAYDELSYIVLFISLLGSLILFLVFFNFVKNFIQDFYTRTRELGIRMVFGSSLLGLYLLLLVDIFLFLFIALMVTMGLTDILLPLYYMYFPDSVALDEIIQIDVWVLYKSYIEIILSLLVISMVIAFGVVYRIKKRILTESIKIGRSGKMVKALLALQFIVSTFFVGSSLGLLLFSNHSKVTINRTLSDEESEHIFHVVLDNVRFMGAEEELLSSIKAIDFVENISLVGSELTRSIVFNDTVSFEGIIKDVDRNYFSFFNLPMIAGRLPATENEIVVSKFLNLELDKLATRTVMINNVYYTVVGVYDQLPFKPMSKNLLQKGEKYRNNVISLSKGNPKDFYVKVQAGKKDYVRSEIEKIIRTKLPNTIPFYLKTFKEEQLLTIDATKSVTDLFLLFSFMSIVIVVLSAYTAITKDVNSMEKQIAVRKIYGASSFDISILLGGIYLGLYITSLVVALPLVYHFLLNNVRSDLDYNLIHNFLFWFSIALIVGVIIFLSIAWKIYKISNKKVISMLRYE